jgi:hypothetical protein
LSQTAAKERELADGMSLPYNHIQFGPTHTSEVALAAGAPLLAQLPIDPTVSALCDAGQIEKVKLPEILGLLESFISAVPIQKPGES